MRGTRVAGTGLRDRAPSPRAKEALSRGALRGGELLSSAFAKGLASFSESGTELQLEVLDQAHAPARRKLANTNGVCGQVVPENG